MSPRSAQDQWVAQELAKALNRVQDPSQLGSTDEVSIHKKLRSFIFFDHVLIVRLYKSSEVAACTAKTNPSFDPDPVELFWI